MIAYQAIPYREKALKMYEQALFYSDYNYISSEFHYGKMLHQTNQFALSLKYLSNVVNKLPNDLNAFIARGHVY